MRLDTGRDRLIRSVDRLQDAPVATQMQPAILAALRQRRKALCGTIDGADLRAEHPLHTTILLIAQTFRSRANQHWLDMQATRLLLPGQQVEDACVAEKHGRTELIELCDHLCKGGMR